MNANELPILRQVLERPDRRAMLTARLSVVGCTLTVLLAGPGLAIAQAGGGTWGG